MIGEYFNVKQLICCKEDFIIFFIMILIKIVGIIIFRKLIINENNFYFCGFVNIVLLNGFIFCFF